MQQRYCSLIVLNYVNIDEWTFHFQNEKLQNMVTRKYTGYGSTTPHTYAPGSLMLPTYASLYKGDDSDFLQIKI